MLQPSQEPGNEEGVGFEGEGRSYIPKNVGIGREWNGAGGAGFKGEATFLHSQECGNEEGRETTSVCGGSDRGSFCGSVGFLG